MINLHIPKAAADLSFVCGCSESFVRTGYRPGAIPLIVAAELRRLADANRPADAIDSTDEAEQAYIEARNEVCDSLLWRADELDGDAQ